MSLTKKIRYHYYNLFDLHKLEKQILSQRATDLSNNEERPIVSLTTVPKRIPFLKPTLVSLLRQTVTPQEIHINIGEDFFQGTPLPHFLKDLKIVKVQWTPKDMGPATKYIPTLERYKNTKQLIIIVDDDMYYAKNLIQDLVFMEKRAEGKKVFCVNGFCVPADLQSASRPSDKEIKSGMKRVAVIEGCGGYTLRPYFVSPEVLKDISKAPQRAHFDDDIWVSGHLSRAQIEKFQIPTGKRKSLVNTIESAISGDRAQLQTEVMEHFKIDWKSEETHKK